MKKYIVVLLVIVMLLVSCGQAVEPIDVKVIMPYGTPALSMVKMVVEKPELEEKVSVMYEPIEAVDVLSTTLINGEVDIAVVPTNLAATLYNKELGYKLAATGVGGNFYLVSTEDIGTFTDINGMEVGLIGRDLTPDAVFRYLLEGNELVADEDVTLTYFAGASELAASFIGGKVKTAMIPEPLLTNVLMKNEKAKVIVDLNDEWKKLTGLDSYPQASLIVKDELQKSHPEFVKEFINSYKESIEWVNANPEEAGAYYEELGIGLNEPIVQKAISRANLSFQSSAEAKVEVMEYLGILYRFNPKLLGDKEIDEGLFLEE